MTQSKPYRYKTLCYKYPLMVEIESIRGCNISPPCPMCGLHAIAATEGKVPMRDLGVEFLERNRALMEHSGYIFFCGLGEPMLSKSFIHFLDNFDPAIPFGFFSNGQLLNDERIEKIASRNLREAAFSIDAGTEETYRKLRGHGSHTLERTLSNIARLVDSLAARGMDDRVVLLFTIMKENYRELPDFLERGLAIGVRHFRTWHLRRESTEGDYTEHERNGFVFRYGEQSLLENRGIYEDFRKVRDECVEIATRHGAIFETEYDRADEYFG